MVCHWLKRFRRWVVGLVIADDELSRRLSAIDQEIRRREGRDS